MSDTPWLVRRVLSSTGSVMARPKLWGKVFASSDTEAITKFINLINVQETPKHFDAIPLK